MSAKRGTPPDIRSYLPAFSAKPEEIICAAVVAGFGDPGYSPAQNLVQKANPPPKPQPMRSLPAIASHGFCTEIVAEKERRASGPTRH